MTAACSGQLNSPTLPCSLCCGLYPLLVKRNRRIQKIKRTALLGENGARGPAGGRAGFPSETCAGTRDKSERRPVSWPHHLASWPRLGCAWRHPWRMAYSSPRRMVLLQETLYWCRSRRASLSQSFNLARVRLIACRWPVEKNRKARREKSFLERICIRQWGRCNDVGAQEYVAGPDLSYVIPPNVSTMLPV